MRAFKNWIRNEDGAAAAEAGLIFPVLLVLLLGTFDMGNGILAAQKNIRASQVTADLITRGRTVDDTAIDEAINAGELAFAPMDSSSFGVDIVSLRFDDEANPEILWRETRGMNPVVDVITSVQALAEAGSGVVMVTTEYTFDPLFSGFIISEISMSETAFARGRRSATVTKE